MEKLTSYALVVAIFACSQLSSVAGIYCFQCNSLYDPECEVIMPNDTSSIFYRPCEPNSEASGREMFCRKIVQTIFDRDGLVRVIRRCGWILHEKKDCYQLTNPSHEEITCQCFYDGCNSASAFLLTPYLFPLPIFTLLLHSNKL